MVTLRMGVVMVIVKMIVMTDVDDGNDVDHADGNAGDDGDPVAVAAYGRMMKRAAVVSLCNHSRDTRHTHTHIHTHIHMHLGLVDEVGGQKHPVAAIQWGRKGRGSSQTGAGRRLCHETLISGWA